MIGATTDLFPRARQDQSAQLIPSEFASFPPEGAGIDIKVTATGARPIR